MIEELSEKFPHLNFSLSKMALIIAQQSNKVITSGLSPRGIIGIKNNNAQKAKTS